MSPTLQTAWQPFTPRGVARFAAVSSARLLLVQSVFSLLAATTLTWGVSSVWFPTLQAAIGKLPDHGEIRSGRLDWVGVSPQVLAEGAYLSVVVDVTHSGTLRGPAHIQVELGEDTVRVFSLFGYAEWRYPRGWVFAMNRPEVEPWWGAWSPVILVAVFLGTALMLPVCWALLAAAYCLPVWLAGYAANRAVDLRGAWRLGGAAQMPGALFLTMALGFYAWGWMDLARLLVAGGVHWIVTWAYLCFSVLALPKFPSAIPAGRNPFVDPDQPENEKPPQPRVENPFGAGGSGPEE